MYQTERDKASRMRFAAESGRAAVEAARDGRVRAARMQARDAATYYLAAINGDMVWR